MKVFRFLLLLLLPLSCKGAPETMEQTEAVPPLQEPAVLPYKLWQATVENTFVDEGSLLWQVDLPEKAPYTVVLRVHYNIPRDLTIDVRADADNHRSLEITPSPYEQVLHINNWELSADTREIEISGLNRDLMILSLSMDNKPRLFDQPLDLKPTNPHASEEVYHLMNYLGEIQGRHILSGQMDLTWDNSINMIDRVENLTGKKPALMGYDFMNYTGAGNGWDGQNQVEEAIEYAEQGGIIAFAWHWRMKGEFYSNKTDFRINSDPESEEYRALIRDIDQIAGHLQKLEDKNIPVLWRPLHEASGGWFWWGDSGREHYLFLWDLMYQRLTEYHQLDNLIWVWNGQSSSWYPGDDQVDIIGVDLYEGKGMAQSYVGFYKQAAGYVEGDKLKLIALTENGAIPSPQKMLSSGAAWSWFMTWNDNPYDSNEDFFSGEVWTSHGDKHAYFNHPYVLNLEDLPPLK